jgi:signal transduction histidine kinase
MLVIRRTRQWGPWSLAIGAALSVGAAWFTARLERQWHGEQMVKDASVRLDAVQANIQRGVLALDMLTAFYLGSEVVEPHEFDQFGSYILAAEFGARWVAWASPEDGQNEVYAHPRPHAREARATMPHDGDAKPTLTATLTSVTDDTCLIVSRKLPRTAAGRERGNVAIALGLQLIDALWKRTAPESGIEKIVRLAAAPSVRCYLRSRLAVRADLAPELPADPAAMVSSRQEIGDIELEFLAFQHPRLPITSLTATWLLLAGGLLLTSVIASGFWMQQRTQRRVENLVDQRTRELSDSHARLEHRVEERTRELTEAYGELEAFGYSVSHDLRAPLRAIEGYAGILADDHATELSAEGDRLLGVIRRSCRRANELIDAMLRLSRLGKQEIVASDVDLGALVATIVADLRMHHGARHEFVVGPLGHVHADAALLREVLQNLLGNAVKFSRNAAAPRVEVARRDEDGFAVVSVRDNGVGFDPTYKDRLFVPFQRLHRADEFEGHGIGLALCHRILRRQGGSVEANAKPGAGADITFRLPLHPRLS